MNLTDNNLSVIMFISILVKKKSKFRFDFSCEEAKG